MTTSTEPDILYHYTSQNGLLGILKDNKLWMTNILYLNDSSEYRHTIDLLKSEVEERKERLSPYKGLMYSTITQEDEINNKTHHTLDILKKFCEVYSDFSRKDTFLQCYVFSLSNSKNGDDLNQWRSYCPKEGGFSIGFDYQRLVSIIDKSEGYTLKKCEYDPEEKQKLINPLLDHIHNSFESDKDISTSLVWSFILVETISFSTFIKHTSFKDEQEYRVIKSGINDDKVNHCEGKSMIIPYVEFSPMDENNKLPIRKIIVGPTPHPELSKLSVQSLLESKGYEGVEVETSNIPFRSW